MIDLGMKISSNFIFQKPEVAERRGRVEKTEIKRGGVEWLLVQQYKTAIIST